MRLRTRALTWMALRAMRVQVNIVARKISGSCFARDERTVNILLPYAPTFLECMLRSCAPQTNGLHSDQCPSIACAAIGDACALGNSQTSVCVHHVVCHACDVVRLSRVRCLCVAVVCSPSPAVVA